MNEQDNDRLTNPPGENAPPPQRRVIRPKATRPMVTYVALGITIAMYLLQEVVRATTGSQWVELYLMKINEYIIAGQFWRLITPILLHGSVLHLAFNMYALYVIGRGLEQQFGSGRYLLLYLVAGFTGNVLSFMITPNPSLGASTSIFGVVAAQGVFIYQNRELFGGNARAMLSNTLMVVALNLFLGATSTGIDNWGHLGGLLGGFAFAWFAGPLLSLHPTMYGYQLTDARGLRKAVVVSSVIVIIGVLLVLQRIMLAGA